MFFYPKSGEGSKNPEVWGKEEDEDEEMKKKKKQRLKGWLSAFQSSCFPSQSIHLVLDFLCPQASMFSDVTNVSLFPVFPTKTSSLVLFFIFSFLTLDRFNTSTLKSVSTNSQIEKQIFISSPFQLFLEPIHPVNPIYVPFKTQLSNPSFLLTH